MGGSAWPLTAWYAQRMTVAELCRDGKSRRKDFAGRRVQVQEPRRRDRLLGIVAWAYLLRGAWGWWAGPGHRPGCWCSSNDDGQGSVFTRGRAIRDRLEFTATAVILAGEAGDHRGRAELGMTQGIRSRQHFRMRARIWGVIGGDVFL